MARRLTAHYAVGERVEIFLGQTAWVPGVVVAHDHPAVWVRTADGRSWFVTNGTRIRKRERADEA